MVVENGRLAWAYGSLWVVESDPKAGGTEWCNCRGCCGCRIAKFDMDLRFALGESWIQEIEI